MKELELDRVKKIIAKRGRKAQAKIIEKMRKALEFYANEEHWEADSVDIGIGSLNIPNSSMIASSDCGEYAREILKQIKQEMNCG